MNVGRRYSFLALLTVAAGAAGVIVNTGCASPHHWPDVLAPAAVEQPRQAWPELEALLARDVVHASFTGDPLPEMSEPARAFYERRGASPAWVNDDGPTDQAATAVALLNRAAAHGLDPEKYEATELETLRAALAAEDDDMVGRHQRLANFDVALTTNLLRLGEHVAVGRTSPDRISSIWEARRDLPDLPLALSDALDTAGVEDWIDHVAPQHPEYHRLQDAMAALVAQAEAGGWPEVPAVDLDRGDVSDEVVALRARLAAGGDLDDGPGDTHGGRLFDARVEDALRRFQARHGLAATGVLDARTVDALNVPIADRLATLALNLERWRWMPGELGDRHFRVNIPAFMLEAYEGGQRALDMRVVVGKRGNETPVFSDVMTHVVFSPYWNIPDSIAVGETAPAAARNASYLSRQNIEVLSASGERIDPSSVDWSDAGEVRRLRLRQRPGPGNALGQVKFMFPNRHAIYLHDTPADRLFARDRRAFSHGCVRVAEPQRLAEYVLRDDAAWSSDRIGSAMRAGSERHVRLAEGIPVHLVYFTAWVDETGVVHYADDVYGYDRRQDLPLGSIPTRVASAG